MMYRLLNSKDVVQPGDEWFRGVWSTDINGNAVMFSSEGEWIPAVEPYNCPVKLGCPPKYRPFRRPDVPEQPEGEDVAPTQNQD